jgi:hypothetical protein
LASGIEAVTLPAQLGVNQRQLVLANIPPPVNRAALVHTGPGPNRRTAARVATPTASTASPTALAVGAGGSEPGANVNAHWVKNAAIAPAREANRRNQPRTVAAGTPNRPAIRR